MNYTTWHEVTDTDKVAAIAASMVENGWIGCPLVADNDQLLTGSHRYVAAGIAGIDAEMIDIRDIVADWDALIDETGYGYEVAVAEVVRTLPADLRRDYGLDIH